MARKNSPAPAPRHSGEIPCNVDSFSPRPDIYPSKKSRQVCLVGGLTPGVINLIPVEGENVDFSSIFECFPSPVAGPEALALGAQLGDLVGHLIHRGGRFDVLIPRTLMASVREAAELAGRSFLVWECGHNEDPDGTYARAEFGPKGDSSVSSDRIAAERNLDWKTVKADQAGGSNSIPASVVAGLLRNASNAG